jgi:hypothetical protein
MGSPQPSATSRLDTNTMLLPLSTRDKLGSTTPTLLLQAPALVISAWQVWLCPPRARALLTPALLEASGPVLGEKASREHCHPDVLSQWFLGCLCQGCSQLLLPTT